MKHKAKEIIITDNIRTSKKKIIIMTITNFITHIINMGLLSIWEHNSMGIKDSITKTMNSIIIISNNLLLTFAK